MENVRLPSTLRRIEYSAFEGCGCLRHITLPERLECVGRKCFCQSALEVVEVPPALNTVGRKAFATRCCLKKIEFLEGRTLLWADRQDSGGWNRAFRDSRAEEVVLPGTLREISPNVFRGCKNLRVVRMAEGSEVDVARLVDSSVEVRRN